MLPGPFILPRARTGQPSLRPIRTIMTSAEPNQEGTQTQDAAVQADVKPKSDETKAEEENKLPPLSAQDYRTYNSIADKMEYFVDTPPPSSHLYHDDL